MPDALVLALAILLVLGLIGVCVALVLAADRAATSPRPAAPERATGRPPRSRFLRRDAATTHAAAGPAPAPSTRHRAAVVVNPTKFTDLAAARTRVTRAMAGAGWAEPLWLETTVEDPGRGQAEQALREQVDLVCSLGGDGTVRTVAGALVGTGTPLGLLPGGTGNLLARNLDLPVNTIEAALEAALGGRNRRIDTGRLVLERPVREEVEARADDPDDPDLAPDVQDAHDVPEPGSSPVTEEHRFLVMAGLGFDAEIMAGASEQLKSRAGWLAYVVSGARHLKGPQFRVDVRTDTGVRFSRRVRSVVVGNVGKLTGGMVLLPDAEVDDGALDTIVLSPQGLVGWVGVAVRVLSKRRRGHNRVEHLTSGSVHVQSDKPVEVQLDGDTLGLAIALDVRVEPASLLVRVPA